MPRVTPFRFPLLRRQRCYRGSLHHPCCRTICTRGGTNYLYHGHTDVKQLALYVQDTITYRNWAFNLGIRGDLL